MADLAWGIDAIPVVASATERDIKFPVSSRSVNQRVYNLSTRTTERWTGTIWAADPSVPTFNVKTEGALGDGVTNDTTAIQTAINAALAVNGTVYFPEGTYITSQLIFNDGNRTTARIRVCGAGWGSVVKLISGSTGQNPFFVTTIAGVTFENLTIDGNKAGQSAPALNCVRTDVNDSVFRTVRFINASRDGIFATPATAASVTRLTVVGCHFENIGDAVDGEFGIAAERVTNVSIVGNVCEGAASGLCDIEPMDVGDVAEDITIIGNVVRNTGAGFSGAAAILLHATNSGYPNVRRAVISGNTINVAGQHGIRVSDINDVVITGNVVTSAALHGIYVTGTTGSLFMAITGNVVRECSTSAANTYDGIHCDILRDGVISGNLVTDTSAKHRYHIRLDANCQRVTLGANSLPRAAQTAKLSIDASATDITVAPIGGTKTLTYGATIATDASLGEHFRITATNGTAFTISNPTEPVMSRIITYDILNSSGGALGAITWGAAFKLAGAFTNPANTMRRTITFRFDGTNWIEQSRAAADI